MTKVIYHASSLSAFSISTLRISCGDYVSVLPVSTSPFPSQNVEVEDAGEVRADVAEIILHPEYDVRMLSLARHGHKSSFHVYCLAGLERVYGERIHQRGQEETFEPPYL